ncbi:MAG: TRAP transporter large permease subunit, partial [Acidobacteriota bacterium]
MAEPPSPASPAEDPEDSSAEPAPPGAVAAFRRLFDRAESLFAGLILLAMVALLVAEMLLRTGSGGTGGIPGALPLVQHLTLWLAFVGAALAASEGRLLSLATGQLLPEGPARRLASGFASAVAAGVTALLVLSSWQFMLSEKEFGDTVVYGIPVWAMLAVLPVTLTLIALRLVWRCEGWAARGLAALVTSGGVWLGLHPEVMEFRPAAPVIAVLAIAMALGAPIFAVLGGAAVLLFMIDAVPIAAVPVETYRLAVSPTLPAIPLFTLTGFLLAEGRASERLIGVFRAWVGWIPGGTAVVAAVVCAFFTVFTGGSGVTILALGGLLFAALEADGYRESFSLGLLTA